MTVVERAIELASEKGWNQSQFARILGIYEGRFSKWKDGQGEPTATQLRDMARVLGVTADFLLNGEDSRLDAKHHAILLTIEALGLDAAEVIRRLHTEPDPGTRPPQAIVPVAVQHTKLYDKNPAKKPSKR